MDASGASHHDGPLGSAGDRRRPVSIQSSRRHARARRSREVPSHCRRPVARHHPGLSSGNHAAAVSGAAGDADGNELAGVRSVEQAVPVATYTGWNFRSPSVGAPKELVSLMGSSVPFAATTTPRARRIRRALLASRYASKEEYPRGHESTPIRSSKAGACWPPMFRRSSSAWKSCGSWRAEERTEEEAIAPPLPERRRRAHVEVPALRGVTASSALQGHAPVAADYLVVVPADHAFQGVDKASSLRVEPDMRPTNNNPYAGHIRSIGFCTESIRAAQGVACTGRPGKGLDCVSGSSSMTVQAATPILRRSRANGFRSRRTAM